MWRIVWRLGHGVCGGKVSKVHIVRGGVVGGVVGVRRVTAQSWRGRRHVAGFHLHLDQGGWLAEQGTGVAPRDGVNTIGRSYWTPEVADTGDGGGVLRRGGVPVWAARGDGGGGVAGGGQGAAQPRAGAVRRGGDARVRWPRLRLDGHGGGSDGVTVGAGAGWGLLQLRRGFGFSLGIGYDGFSLGWLLSHFGTTVFEPNLENWHMNNLNISTKTICVFTWTLDSGKLILSATSSLIKISG